MRKKSYFSKKGLGKGLMDRRDFLKTMGVAGGAALTSAIPGTVFLARSAEAEIRIGHATALSGVYAIYGNRIDKGIRLAFSLSKYKDRAKFFLEDTQVKPEVAVQKALKKVDEKILEKHLKTCVKEAFEKKKSKEKQSY